MPTPLDPIANGPNRPDHSEQGQDAGPASHDRPLHPGDFADDEVEPLSSRDIDSLVAAGVLEIDVEDPPVPVTGWRVTSLGQQPALGVPPFTGLTPRLAALLITLYSRAGHLVVDLTADLAVEGAAGAGARRYLRIHPAEVSVLANARRRDGGWPPADLVLLRWSPEPVARPDPNLELLQLLRECRGLLDRAGRVIVITGPSRAESTRLVVTTARQARLRLQHHHVFVALAAALQADEVLDDVRAQPISRLDLLVFTPSDGHGW